ncbi:MAG: threonylcarbamoyl-AMP synthase [Balneolaceae bacterium]|nr:MAG: threonylcarbamoyl-AMP synthase [Balneolaceae bacterium]
MIISLDKAVELIRRGEVVAFPTETVYGLGANAKNVVAVQKTFDVKGRPADNPLIVHISDMNQVYELATDIPDSFKKLANHFWPGPLTMVLKKQAAVPDIVTAGLDSVAIRMPDHPIALELIRNTGPLTAPSANRSGKPSPTKPEHIIEDYGDELPVVDGGSSKIGLESTVLDLTSKQIAILRPGAISAEMIKNLLKTDVIESSDHTSDPLPKSPGVKYTHYKPKATVNWIHSVPSQFDSKTFYILHSKMCGETEKNVVTCNGNFDLLAKLLYDYFRTADHLGYSQILVEALPKFSPHPLIPPLNNRISKSVES